jgi:hypothetical protein
MVNGTRTTWMLAIGRDNLAPPRCICSWWSAVYFGNWQQERNVPSGEEQLPMLVFFLPLIILDAMLGASAQNETEES